MSSDRDYSTHPFSKKEILNIFPPLFTHVIVHFSIKSFRTVARLIFSLLLLGYFPAFTHGHCCLRLFLRQLP